MDKRSGSGEDYERTSKMLKKDQKTSQSVSDKAKKGFSFSQWKKVQEPISTPSTVNSKQDFTFWNKTKSKAQCNPIGTTELNLGKCLNRPIQFRVSFKSEKRSNINGEMFYFHIADESGEIQVTAFPETIAFFDLIKLNCTYQLTNFNVNKEEANFPLFVGAGKYISLLKSSKIDAIDNDTVPVLQFNFVPINKIKDLEPNSKCDVIAIIAKNWGAEAVGVGGKHIKCDLSLTDKSKEGVIVSLWGSEYGQLEEGTVVIIHNGVVKEFNGIRSLNCASRTLFWHDPDTDAAKDLKSWFDMEKKKFE
ncbi:hypothetical protein HA402_004596 [Bradysia odoriphaga]|nr:hypothetical protein HA402_004596 [Bradysia odoriphaga]